MYELINVVASNMYPSILQFVIAAISFVINCNAKSLNLHRLLKLTSSSKFWT